MYFEMIKKWFKNNDNSNGIIKTVETLDEIIMLQVHKVFLLFKLKEIKFALANDAFWVPTWWWIVLFLHIYCRWACLYCT